MEIEMENRKDVLLKAAFDLLKQQDDSGFVLNILECQIDYDDAECDGLCLLNDIADELEINR